MHQCTKRNSDDESNPTIDELLQRAQIIRREMCGDNAPSFIFDYEQLAYPHPSYEMKLDVGRIKHRNSELSQTGVLQLAHTSKNHDWTIPWNYP